MNMERGKSIVIEGNDGTGKSTQVELLAGWLQDTYDIGYLTIHEPNGPTKKSQELRKRIKDARIPRTPLENLQWFTESRQESNRYARDNHIQKGDWVLRARNWRSTEAYQGAGEGVSSELIRQMTADNTDELYMNPDLEVILFVNDETRRQRIQSRGKLDAPDTFESKGDKFQRKVNNRYIDIAHRDGLPLIDASAAPEDVQLQIRELIWLRGLLPRR
jgi:dTMP kinase